MNSTIKGVGIDTVTVDRFAHWNHYSDKQLQKIFSHQEIKYARSNELFFAQRLAVRFAAKEAFFKALQQIFPNQPLSLVQIAKAVSVSKEKSGNPFLIINWSSLFDRPVCYDTMLSLSHERCHATAIIILLHK